MLDDSTKGHWEDLRSIVRALARQNALKATLLNTNGSHLQSKSPKGPRQAGTMCA